MNVEIVDRNGWKYARMRKPRGQGRSFFQSLGTKNEEDARKKVTAASLGDIQLAAQADALTREVWTRLIAGRKVSIRDSMTRFSEHRAITGHPNSSAAHEQQCLDQFVRFSGGDAFNRLQIAAVEPAHVAAFINRPGDATLATRTRQLTWLTGWLNYCLAQRWLVVSPVLEVRVRTDSLTQKQLVSVPYAPFTEKEIKALLAALPRTDFWHGAVLMAYHFGLRLGAIAMLEEGNIVAHQLRVFTTKGRRIVNERLPDELIAWFDEWKAQRPPSDLNYVFPEQAATHFSDGARLSKHFRVILDRNGFREALSFHGIRKTATDKRWSAELDELGAQDKRALMKLVAEKGFRRVQQLLAHDPGSSVTQDHYFPAPTT